MYNKIPKNWEKVKLKKYIEIVRGVNYKSNEVYDYKNDNTTGILRANNISNNGMLNFEKIIYVDKKNIKNEQMIKNGDIVIAMSSGSKNLVGKAAQAKQNLNFAFGAFCSVVRPKNINSDFLGFYFLTDYYRNKISELSTGININNLRKDYIENLDIMVPLDPKEQEKIVQVLDTMSDIIRLRKECISHAQDLIPALFQEMFKNYENNTILLSSICDIKGGKRLPSGEKLIDAKTEHPYLRVTNFKNQNIDMNDIKYITEDVYKKISRYVITTGDIYISIVGTIGLVGDIPNELNNANLTENAARLIIDKKKVNKKYLIYCLNSTFLQQQIKEATVGVGVPKLALSRIGTLKIYLPDIKIQEQFAQKAIEIESYIKEQQEELENAKQMFQSLLHHAFTGKLTSKKDGECNE